MSMPNTTPDALSAREREILLRVAREAIAAAVGGNPPPVLDIEKQPPSLQADGASFVTLTRDGRLRGCIGTMEPYQPLLADVQEHAAAAAVSDFRFSKVTKDELEHIQIEISRLTPLKELPYDSTEDLTRALRAGVDGVLINAGGRRATFLPQVWEQLPQPEEFLSHLCQKMGAPADLWKTQKMDVYTYQVEKFCE